MAPPRTVTIEEGDGGCLLWMGATNDDGYGRCGRRVDGKLYTRAHRWAWASVYGDPGDLLVCHTCDNPRCVNVDHLWLGTDLDNARDRAFKGRSGPRPGNRKGKLTVEQRREAVGLYLAGAHNQYELASMYGVDQSAISYLVRRHKDELSA